MDKLENLDLFKPYQEPYLLGVRLVKKPNNIRNLELFTTNILNHNHKLDTNKQINLLELFAGSRSVGKAAESIGFNVFSVDWTDYDDIDLVIDIGKLTAKDIPFVPDVVWASPDCTTYSVAACNTHRHNSIEPKTKYARECDSTNNHFISLIKKWLLINPNMIFFIENPRGMMRRMPFMIQFDRKTIWYCQYGDSRAKPTDIWTNTDRWKPRAVCSNDNPNCNHDRAPRGSRTGTQGIKGKYDRSVIPIDLCEEILRSLI